jgi:isochorismate synthase
MGATPEIAKSQEEVCTMALAGTQNYEDTIDVVWEKIVEQQLC